MKTIYNLKDDNKAVIHGITYGDFSDADAMEEHNNTILADVYKRIQFGLSDYAYISSGGADGGLIHVVSRDTVYSGVVRVSVFVRYGSGRDARIYPSSHNVFKRVKDLLNYGLPSGRLVVVGGWYDKLLKGAA
jgi:hypothetical protein